jgi:hypothetical protein
VIPYYGPVMAPSMFDKAVKWARSPQGQRAIAKAQQVAKDPATRAKVQQLRGRAEAAAKDPANRARIEKLRGRVTGRPGDDGPGAPPAAGGTTPPPGGTTPPPTGGTPPPATPPRP